MATYYVLKNENWMLSSYIFSIFM